MLIKPLDLPMILRKLPALIRRTPPGHKSLPYMVKDLRIRQAGQAGEENMNYHLSFLPYRTAQIYRGLRLPRASYHFQMDGFVLTRQYGLIIEAKNLAGTLTYKSDFNQFIQTVNNQDKGIRNPLIQAENQMKGVRLLLEKWTGKTLPLDYFVAISSPATILQTDQRQNIFTEKVFHMEQLAARIEAWSGPYRQPVFSDGDLAKVQRLLLSSDTEFYTDIVASYKMAPAEMICGLFCHKCRCFKVVRKGRCWWCTVCDEECPHAFREGVEDYFLLHGNTMTNQQCRRFLKYENRHVIRRSLLDMGVEVRGEGRNQVYLSPFVN